MNAFLRLAPALLLAAAAPSAPAAATDRAAVFRAIHAGPECDTASISPDGKLLAAIFRTADGVSLRIAEIDGDTPKLNLTLAKESDGLSGGDRIWWVSATRLLVQISRRDIVAVDADGKNLARIVDWREDIWHDQQSSIRWPFDLRMVALPQAEPEHVYIVGYSLSRNVVRKVHLASGKAEAVHDVTAGGAIICDERGTPRVRMPDFREPIGYELQSGEAKAARWVPLDRVVGALGEPQFAPTAATMHGPRSLPIGFGRDPDVLYIASNVGRDTVGIYGLNVKTGRRTEFALEHPYFDLAAFSDIGVQSAAIWDRRAGVLAGMRCLGARLSTIWADRELAEVQQRIEALAPGTSVAIESWDDARGRFLARISTRTEPGFFAVFDRTADKLPPGLPCAPALAVLPRVRSAAWSLKRADGTLLHGSLALPAGPRVRPIPVVVVMRTALWGNLPAGYAPEVRALAQMGYAVLEVAHRGILGLGLRHWEAGRGKLDTVIAEDVGTALDRIGVEAGLETGKVALWGTSFGGTMALKLARLIPERVACVVAVGPLQDVQGLMSGASSDLPQFRQINDARRAFFGPTDAQLKAWSPVNFAGEVTQPTLVVTVRNSYSLPDDRSAAVIKRMSGSRSMPEVVKESSEKGRPEMNVRIAEAAEKFLAKHFPAVRP